MHTLLSLRVSYFHSCLKLKPLEPNDQPFSSLAILKQIKDRKLDEFFELETKLMNRAALERGVLDVLLNPEMGSPDDKLRFFLIYYLVGQSEMSKVQSLLNFNESTLICINLYQIIQIQRFRDVIHVHRASWNSLQQP
jgi:hypothetical protein